MEERQEVEAAAAAARREQRFNHVCQILRSHSNDVTEWNRETTPGD